MKKYMIACAIRERHTEAATLEVMRFPECARILASRAFQTVSHLVRVHWVNFRCYKRFYRAIAMKCAAKSLGIVQPLG